LDNLVVTGASGFLGRHLVPVLKEHYRQLRIIGLDSSQYDLMDPIQVRRMFEETRPEILVHLAAYSGGIGSNRRYPADYYYRNTILTALVFEEAARFKVSKMVYPMGGCSYPATAHSPIDESQMWEGFPQHESAGYSSAKKMGIVASSAYRQQYGLNSIVVIPGNVYGEYDNFRNEESHVVPAMIRRCYEAKLAGVKEIVMWGTGAPVRDFVYAGDVARVIPWFIDRYHSSEPVNISSGTRTSIRELAELIVHEVGLEAEIRWDSTKPNGQMVKIFDTSRLRSLGLLCDTPLVAGVRATVAWFARNYADRSDGIRL
jgi:GDP-L-fucose synthase